MATVTDTANRLFPVLLTGGAGELTPEQITIGGTTRETRRFTDTDTAGFVFNNTATGAQYDFLDLSTEFIVSNDNTGFVFNDSEINLLELVAGGQSDRRGTGAQTFNRTRIYRVGGETTGTNNRLILGCTGAGTWNTMGSTFIGFRNNELALLYQNAPSANTTNAGLILIGNVASEYSSAHTSLQTTWNNGGGSGQADAGIYTYRITQFNETGAAGAAGLAETDNVANVEAGTGTRVTALFVGDDLRNIATAGNDANYGDGTTQTFVMNNRRSSHWIVGGRYDGTLPVGHHIGNRPFPAEPAEIRYIVPFNPTFQDANNVTLASNVRARFYDTAGTAEVRNIFAPATWDPTAPPVFASGVDRTLAGTHWIEDSRTLYQDGTQSTGDSSPCLLYTSPSPRDS